MQQNKNILEIIVQGSDNVFYDPITTLVRTKEEDLLGFGSRCFDGSIDINLFFEDNGSIN